MATFLVFLPAAVVLCSGAAPPPAPLTEAQVQRLIRQLGSANYQTREEATRQLLGCEAAASVLRRALTSSDAEVISRSKFILDAFARRQLKRSLERIRADAAEMKADLLADRMAHLAGGG
jgi:hypothetical protein